MKTFARSCCSFLFSLALFFLSACTVTVSTNNPAVSPVPSAVDTQVVPATAIVTSMPTDLQPVPQETTAVGSGEPVPFIKPAESELPAAGICGSGPGEIVQIGLGTGSDGLPIGGRCVQVTPLQRIELVNQTSESFHVSFGMFDVEVPAGGVLLLDKPVGEYLAPGVHSLPNGPVIWLKIAE